VSRYLRVNTATEYGVALKPTSITHVEAAGAPFAVLAAYNAVVNLGELPVGDKARPGKRVLIIGASGGMLHKTIYSLLNYDYPSLTVFINIKASEPSLFRLQRCWVKQESLPCALVRTQSL
jgi:hypothetical protein